MYNFRKKQLVQVFHYDLRSRLPSLATIGKIYQRFSRKHTVNPRHSRI